ncbi:MAG: hypothetical protein L3J89_03840 [Gammaproteobacteria bacterium]|nr:hypothetical protein [Gammaproteobacteria bacterium]
MNINLTDSRNQFLIPAREQRKIKIDKMQPAHEKLSKVYKSEVSSMARSNVVLKSTRRGMRALRSRKHSIDLTRLSEVLRLKRFLKIASVSAVGAIVIDATFAGQKVKNAAAAGENAEKVAYEEYGALAIGIFGAGLATIFLGPGLIILTVAGGVSALAGVKGVHISYR